MSGIHPWAATVVVVLSIWFGFWLGRLARHETIVSYDTVDLQAKLAALGQQLHGCRLSGTSFDLSYDAPDNVDAHAVVEQLIALARNTPTSPPV